LNKQKSVLVIGLGEVDMAIYEIFVESGKYNVYGYDVDKTKSINSILSIPAHINFVHIAFPCVDCKSFIS